MSHLYSAHRHVQPQKSVRFGCHQKLALWFLRLLWVSWRHRKDILLLLLLLHSSKFKWINKHEACGWRQLFFLFPSRVTIWYFVFRAISLRRIVSSCVLFTAVYIACLAGYAVPLAYTHASGAGRDMRIGARTKSLERSLVTSSVIGAVVAVPSFRRLVSFTPISLYRTNSRCEKRRMSSQRSN